MVRSDENADRDEEGNGVVHSALQDIARPSSLQIQSLDNQKRNCVVAKI